MSESKEEQKMDPAILQSIAIAKNITNFMKAIQVIKDGMVKSITFNSVTTIYRVGELARVDIKAPLDPEKLRALPIDIIDVPETVTAEDMDNAAKIGTQMTNFMRCIEMVKAGEVIKIGYNDKTMVYRVGDIVRVDIKAPRQ